MANLTRADDTIERTAFTGSAQPEKSVTFGAILPLTGGAADQGEWARNGIKLAVDQLNHSRNSGPAAENPAPRPVIKVIFEDSRGESKAAIAAYNAMRARYDIPAIFTWGSGVGIALTPLVNRDKVIQIGIATGSPDYSTLDDFTFRTFHSNLDEAAFADSVIDRLSGGKPVAILKIQNDYGIAYGDEVRRLLEKRGKNVVFDETFAPGETDFRQLLLKMKAVNPAAIVLISYPAEGAVILAQKKQLGITAPVLASVAVLSSRSFFKLTGSAAEGLRVIVPTNRVIQETALMKDFVADYMEQHGEDLGIINWYAARAYDSVMVTASLLGRCPQADAACLREQLYTIKDFPGVAGPITFDRAGDIATVFTLDRINGQKFEADDEAAAEH